MRVSLASSGGVWGRRGVPPAGPPEPGFSPPSQSNLMVPVLIGCPPGKRLAFDITYKLQYNRVQNKHYFDCVKVDPEMPCFLFRDSGCPAPSPLLSPALPACPLTAPTHPLLFLWVLSSLLLPLSHFSSRPPPLRPHREAAAQAATCLQHPLPVQGPRPAANVRGECVWPLHLPPTPRVAPVSERPPGFPLPIALWVQPRSDLTPSCPQPGPICSSLTAIPVSAGRVGAVGSCSHYLGDPPPKSQSHCPRQDASSSPYCWAATAPSTGGRLAES